MLKDRLWKFCLAGLGACLFMVATAAPAQAQQGIGERIGEQLDRGIGRLSEELREGWQSLQKSLDKMGVRGRVYSRLRWDKHLAASKLDIDVEEGGVVTLRGRLANAAVKEKAIELTKDTVGVNRIIDELTIEPSTEDPDHSPRE